MVIGNRGTHWVPRYIKFNERYNTESMKLMVNLFFETVVRLRIATYSVRIDIGDG